MIYSKPLLQIRILFESIRRKPIFGIYRPQAYINGSKKYCSNIRLDQFKKEIVFGEHIVMKAVLEAPVGYGKNLSPGVLLVIKDGLDPVGKAVVLEINGYEDQPSARGEGAKR